MEAAVTRRRTMTRITTRTRIMMMIMMRKVLLPATRSMKMTTTMRIMTRMRTKMTSMTSLIPGMRRRKMRKTAGVITADAPAAAVPIEVHPAGAGDPPAPAEAGAPPEGAEALPAEAEVPPVEAATATGAVLLPWTATRYGASPAKEVAPTMKKEGPTDMMKAEAVQAVADARPVAAAAAVHLPEAVRAEVLPAAADLRAEAEIQGNPVTRVDSLPAAADGQAMAAVPVAAVPATADAPPVAAAAPAGGKEKDPSHKHKQIEPINALFVCSSNIHL
jgi:hypothetical protein